MTQACVLPWLLIHSECSLLSFALISLCLFTLPLLSITPSDVLCSYTGGEGWAWSPSGERRARSSSTYSPLVTFTVAALLTEVFSPHPIGSARCRGVQWHERRKSKCHWCQVSELTSPSKTAWNRQKERSFKKSLQPEASEPHVAFLSLRCVSIPKYLSKMMVKGLIYCLSGSL